MRIKSDPNRATKTYEAVTRPGDITLPTDMRAGDTFIVVNQTDDAVTVQPLTTFSANRDLASIYWPLPEELRSADPQFRLGYSQARDDGLREIRRLHDVVANLQGALFAAKGNRT